jgi:hypothetical protein
VIRELNLEARKTAIINKKKSFGVNAANWE